jgi:large subunit ribosomal protein L22
MDIEVRAKVSYVRMSPRKAKLVVDTVRGKGVKEALTMLKYSTKAAAHPVSKVIKSAAANAEENYGLSPDDLYVAQIYADEGPTLKRAMAGARGRSKPILKRSTHITVVLGSREESAQ